VQERDLKNWKGRLLEERGRIVQDLEALEEYTETTPREASGGLSSYSSHMADMGTDAMEREKAFLFTSVKKRRLSEIDQALARIEAGTFGVCESCGQAIPAKRLERLPDASLCVACKEKQEKEQGTPT
jgi:RNA polymerase-binding protein DksA